MITFINWDYFSRPFYYKYVAFRLWYGEYMPVSYPGESLRMKRPEWTKATVDYLLKPRQSIQTHTLVSLPESSRQAPVAAPTLT